jgi:ABC-type transporter MlaC component
MKNTALFIAAISTSLIFSFSASAGHPAADRVTDALEEATRVASLPVGSQPRAMCAFIGRHIAVGTVGPKLLGKYSRSSDTAGVQEFLRHSSSLMATKAFDKLKDLKGESGSFSVGNPSNRGSGFVVPVTVRTSKGKSYNGRAVVNANLNIVDVEYLGFSGVTYAARDIEKDLNQLARTSSTPVTAYMNQLKSEKGFISCR